MEKKVELSNTIVVQQSEIVALSASAMSDFINSTTKRVMVVENVRKFFSQDNLIAAMNSGNIENIRLICEHSGGVVTKEDMQVLNDFIALKEKFCSNVKGSSSYTSFAKVPANWSVENKLVITKAYVCRKYGDYSISTKTLRKIWDVAAPYWTENDVDQNAPALSYGKINVGGYRDRPVNITPKSVTIGCQTVDRYELEQVAKYLEWI